MKRTLFLVGLSLLTAGSVLAASHVSVIKQRQGVMQEVRGLSKALNDMAKGATPFDLATVTSSGSKLVELATIYPTLFPEGSETGEETKAAPTIWSNRAGFEAEAAKLKAAGEQLAAATDEIDFQEGLDAMNSGCKACHSQFQIR